VGGALRPAHGWLSQAVSAWSFSRSLRRCCSGGADPSRARHPRAAGIMRRRKP